MADYQYSFCVQLLKDFSPMVITAVAGLTATWYSHVQAEAARNRLKLDIFRRRFVIYDAIKKILVRFSRHGTITPSEVDEYYKRINGMEFYFRDEARKYVEDLRDDLYQLDGLKGRLRDDHPGYGGLVNQISEIETRIADRIFVHGKKFRETFATYLDLSEIGI